MAVVTMRQLLEAGVHFGHQTRRWNPKMRRFIHNERNGIYIIDIEQTIGMLEQAYDFVRDSVAKGGTVLFVGTKKQAQEAIEQQAFRVGMPYVNYRWLGGMLTNFETMKSRLVRLRELEEMERSGTMDLLPKKEVLGLRREAEKLRRNLGGIRSMNKLPSAVWVLDTSKEHIAVKEANRLGIPVVAVVDTNCDPDLVQFVIPGNDDAIRSGALLTRIIADACAEGYELRAARTTDDVVAEQAAAAAAAAGASAAVETGGAEPLAEWEIALQREEAARQAAQATGAGGAPPEREAAPAAPEAAEPPAAPAQQPGVEPVAREAAEASPAGEPSIADQFEQALGLDQPAADPAAKADAEQAGAGRQAGEDPGADEHGGEDTGAGEQTDADRAEG